MCVMGRNYQFSQSRRRQYKYTGVNVGERNSVPATGHQHVGNQNCRPAKCRNNQRALRPARHEASTTGAK